MKKYHFLFSCLFLFASVTAAQQFKKSVIINTPGNNYDYSVYSPNKTSEFLSVIWLNKSDSMYSTYFKFLLNPESEGEKIGSGSDSLSSIKLSGRSPNIHAVWKQHKMGYSQIQYWFFGQDAIGGVTIHDSLELNAMIDIGSYYLAWTDKGILRIDNMLDFSDKLVLIDSSGCSSPDIQYNSDSMFVKVLYTKDTLDFSLIKYAEVFNSIPAQINKEIKAGGINSNPRFGNGPDDGLGISYQVYEDGVWKVFYSPYMGFAGTLTTNVNCNYYDPQVFAYDVPVTKSLVGTTTEPTPFFVVYESDSIEGNSEIMLQPFYFDFDYPVINLSNQPGRDYNPKICTYTENDTQYVCVFWQNELDGRNTIYMAKTVYDPIYTIVCYKPVYNFRLEQNYPNPFNNSTTIQYGLSEQMLVNMKIYDILGKEIAELVNEVQSRGNYRVPVNAAGLASGTYFVKMIAGDKQLVRKIMLMK